MGKIYDALEKSKERPQLSRPKEKTSAAEIRRSIEKRFARNAARKVEGADEALPGASQDDGAQKPFPAVDQAGGLLAGRPIHKNLITLLNPRSYEAEQFKILRTGLLFPSSGKPARSIMVTSALPGEGKSFVASNLAVTIAQNINDYVLLMDCDLRKPTIQRYFGFENAPGMSDYLAHGKPLEHLLLKSGLNKLTILPGGKPPHNPSELLSSNKMSELLEEVKNRYSDRYVIIDSPPPKLTAETSALAKQVDGILLVVKFGGTAREAVRELVGHLGKEKILGVIANWFDLNSLDGYHYGTYKKYSDYYGS